VKTTRETWDVIVVGGGGAGLAAAIEAAETGASALVIEKAHELRGSTGRSIGSITASGTPDQKRLGIIDSPEEHVEDMAKFTAPFSDRENVDLARLMAARMAETVAWLRSLGVELFGPFEEPPHRKPRMHLVLPNSMAYIHHLSRRASRLGVTIWLSSPASSLHVDRGRVTGVNVMREGQPIRLTARRGVVLAGGDFSNSPELKREFCNDAFASVPAVNVWNTGDCQRMGRQVGGVVLKGDYVPQPQLRFVPPANGTLLARLPPIKPVTALLRWGLQALPPQWIRPLVLRFATTVMAPDRSLFENGAVLVNKAGRLIRRRGEDVGFAIARNAPEGAYFIFDADLYKKYSAWPHFVSTAPGVAYAYMPDYRRNRPDLYAQSDTLVGLALKLGMPEEALQEAIKDYTENTLSGAPAIGTVRSFPSAPPFAALGPLYALVNLTNGGLKVSPNMEVLREDSSPIAGLFAAGSAGQGGVFLWGHGHHLGWAFTSGRIAGRSAAGAAPI
jgi:fumarate reductase flavoprotein subunit